MSLAVQLGRLLAADRKSAIESLSTAPSIGAQLGLHGQEEDWFGIGKQWSFTRLLPGPGQGCTFYVPVGSSYAAVRARWQQKLAAYSATTH